MRKPGILCILVTGMMFSPLISAASTLTGTVVDAVKSTPIPGASVSVDVLIPDSVSFNTLSTPSGIYSLSNIPGGNAIYVIRCYVAGFADFYMRYDALASGDRQVDILMYPRVEPPGGGGGDSTDVSGIVLYETPGGARNPVMQATVTLKSGEGETSSSTGADGRYAMRLRRASYALSVVAPDYVPLTAGGISVDSAGLILNILLQSAAVAVPPDLDAGPESFALENAYPNPFNPTTVIRFQLPVVSLVRLVVVDILGHEVRLLVNEEKPAGNYEVRFDASGLASGAYVCRLSAGGFVQTKKLLLVQ